MKVVAPAKGCIEVDGLTGRRYRARDGIYDMNAVDAKGLVAAGGFLPSLAGTSRPGVGYRCACGFRPYFSTCSRCGRAADKDA